MEYKIEVTGKFIKDIKLAGKKEKSGRRKIKPRY